MEMVGAGYKAVVEMPCDEARYRSSKPSELVCPLRGLQEAQLFARVHRRDARAVTETRADTPVVLRPVISHSAAGTSPTRVEEGEASGAVMLRQVGQGCLRQRGMLLQKKTTRTSSVASKAVVFSCLREGERERDVWSKKRLRQSACKAGLDEMVGLGTERCASMTLGRSSLLALLLADDNSATSRSVLLFRTGYASLNEVQV